jgi:glyoxylase-like metal-dependent hydrolase (beta-lactamase superfamily II)
MTTERVTQVHERLFQIKLPLPIRPREVQVYFFDNDDRSVLIDTGLSTDESLDVLEQSLKQIGREFSDIAATICTHFHPDHFGASQRIKQLSNCEVLLHKADAEYLFRILLLDPGPYRSFLVAHGLPVNGEPLAPPTVRVFRESYQPALPDKYIADGELLDFGGVKLRVIWTPGHTPGHVVFHWEEQKILFSGDHLLPHITPHVGIHTGIEANPLAAYLSSLNRLAELDIDRIMPAHGSCFADHNKRIAQAFQHHEKRQQSILDGLKRGPATAYELALTLFDESLPDLHKELAAFEVLAHLELMRSANRVQTQRVGEEIRFSV